MSQRSPIKPSVFRAVAILTVIIGLVALFVQIGSALHIVPLYAGFFFLLYWAGIRRMSIHEFLPALLGALGGLGTGWLLHVAPAAYGTAGLAAALLVVCAAIYLQVRGEFSNFINPGFMLFLTLSTAPPVASQGDFRGMALAILSSAGFFGGLFFLVSYIAKQRAAPIDGADRFS